MCSVVAHEWGHLLGYGHVADPNNLMNPITPINVVAAARPGASPAASPEPSETTPVQTASAPGKTTTRKAARTKKTTTCAGKAKSRSTKRAKATKRCTTARKRAKSKSRR